MAITSEEKAATIEAIGAGTELSSIPALAELGDAVVIRTTQQDADYRQGIIETEVEPAIKSRIGEVHGGYDKDIKDITGLDRPADVKTYDFLKTVLNDNKSKVSQLETTIEGLKAGGGADNSKLIEKHEAEKTALEVTFQEKLAEKDTALNNFKIEVEGNQKKSTVESVFNAITPRLIQNLPPMFNKTLDYMRAEASRNTKVEADGTVIMVDAQGLELRNSNMQKITLENHLLNELKDVIQQTPAAGGTGAEPPKGGAPSPADVEKFKDIAEVTIPEGINTKLKLSNHIESVLKIRSNDHKFGLILEKFGASLPMR